MYSIYISSDLHVQHQPLALVVQPLGEPDDDARIPGALGPEEHGESAGLMLNGPTLKSLSRSGDAAAGREWQGRTEAECIGRIWQW